MTTNLSPAVRPHVKTAQLLGTRSYQCDATATWTDRASGRRAFVVLDGIGDSAEVAEWVPQQARRLARRAACKGSPRAALDGLRQIIAAEPGREDERIGRYLPDAVAVVAVLSPRGDVTVVWCGDARAYLLPPGGKELRLLTKDHNVAQMLIDLGQEPGPDAHNRVLSHLGATHTPIGETSVPAAEVGSLLLCSDGLYHPLELTPAGRRTLAETVASKDALGPVVGTLAEFAQGAARRFSTRVDNTTAMLLRFPRP